MANVRKGVALITGAGQGIGRSIALRLAEDGFDVGLNDIEANKDKLELLAADITQKHESQRRTYVFVADVSEEKDVQAMVDTVVRELGGLDVMVANAGVVRTGSLFEASVADWDAVLSVNVRGTFLCYKYAAQHMVNQGGGRIIGACSLAGKIGHAYLSAYSASKFAVKGLTQSAARELGRYGITVNAYAPGPIQTSMLTELHNSEVKRTGDPGGFYKVMENTSALGYLGNTGDVASLVSYLASPEAHFITGQSITVDGGIYFD
ncbi:hypothetical protein SERLA73DRAFT_188531 [Serpula lacrymans var. lacrymans S7.3]|uniref:NAD(P)-binding protein n=2 Tax=Serpula lacrymans var. lacrymans TaxID=341189 RepID=F8QBH6_SERL3|nr:uncharacterized protein SERLADRAFT_478670 [Serpula lacrymans var. lacrymans S7.9]EGN94562.1 hypothetical protein SERLA73DRAFT_188531 [Serpula lacrymans var. lacrymans S7.3]EGO20040.1 hypothetical protein SERLADRAFT_478670 [Serpula lacrymans var. lacrymans S7.9]